MIIIWYVLLIALLFGGAKLCKKKTWNEENMSFYQTKCYLGFCAVIIVFHHISQDTCASWLNPRFIRHGLDIFLAAGYPMVGMFLFIIISFIFLSSFPKCIRQDLNLHSPSGTAALVLRVYHFRH